MHQISSYFYSKTPVQNEVKCNVYYDAFIEILIKRRDKLLSVYNIISTYSINSKRKIDDMLSEKNDMIQAINKLKQHENIVTYYYCKDDKFYYLFEYSLTPTIRKNNNDVDISINDSIDGSFSTNISVESIKDILAEPKKYINFDPKKITIKGNNILSQLIIFNEEKVLTDVIEKYKINITDNIIDSGIKYYDLLDLAIKTNNGNIVNILNKCHYEPKIEKMEKTISNKSENYITGTYRVYYDYMIKISPVINCILLPLIFYTNLRCA
jgi:hypothetical protein